VSGFCGGGVARCIGRGTSGGSGFSFGDLLADRAGIRFANAATRSRDSAQAFAERVATEFQAAVLFPANADMPEKLGAEKFRQTIGLVGSPRYQELIREIEQRLDGCEWLQGY
jgi:hypothetical protein